MMKVLAITRAERFSPNSISKDRAILDAVVLRLRTLGCDVTVVSEESLGDTASMDDFTVHDLILTMGRLPETLVWLKATDAEIINAPEGIENCVRNRLLSIMEHIGTPTAPKEGTDGYWLKRSDAAQESGDVVFAADKDELAAAIQTMRQRGINDYVISAHVVGDLLKFYGVGQGLFFRYYYPTDDGQTKFGVEQHNGIAHHYQFQEDSLRLEAERLAEAAGVSIYGGDAIVRADGTFCIIDFNDWPSFSRCREEAADAIVSLVKAHSIYKVKNLI